MSKEKIKVYLYTRVSTSIQIDGYSLEAQKSRMKAFALYNDYEIVGEYEDAGKSGKSIEGRIQFTRMMEDIKSGKDGVSFVLVFKLSRFARNAADVLSTLQIMQDFGVNLICVEDGIDSSKDAGKLMISVLSAVAEIERENIRVQTMEGRIQKAREGKWNGGFAPYGYQLIDGKLLINEEEAIAIRTIFDQYVNTSIGANGLSKYLENHGIRKIPRQNGKNPLFDAGLIRKILKNPVYNGKIAFGRRTLEKVHGTRNEYKQVEQDEYLISEGIHEAIVSDEVWQAAQVKLKSQAKKYEHVNKGKDTRTHLLSGIVKCPICGVGMFGNKCIKKKKDGTKYKDFYYYGCKHRQMIRGHKCTFSKQIREELLDDAVAEVIIKLVSNPKFASMMQEKINMKVDTSAIENEIDNYQKELRKNHSTKFKLIEEIDNLDVDDKHYKRRKQDLDDRLYRMYDKIEELESLLIDAKAKKQTIEAEKLTGDNIYKVLIYFDKLYKVMNDVERRQLISALISEIQIFEEKQPNGQWLKSITFKLPIIEENLNIGLDNDEHVETVVLLSRETINDYTIGNLNLSNNQQTVMETDAKRRIAGKFTDNRPMTDGLKTDALSKFRIYKEKLKCSFLGDSITEGINTTKTYHEYLAELCGIEARNFGANGSCISTYTLDASLHYYCMVERVETVDKDSDMVFVFGGTNDFNRGCPMGTFESKDKNTFKGALSVMLQYLKDHFPNKKIYLLTPIRRGIFDSQPTDLQANSIGLYLTDYVDAIKEAGELFDIEVIDLHTLTGLNPNDKECADQYFHNSGSIDNLHPNAKGHLVIAETICRHLLKA